MAEGAARVAFLRAVNVGGREVPMPALASMVSGLGLGGARTWLRSGNVVFRAGPEVSDLQLEASLESAVQHRFGLSTDVLVRSGSELEKLLRANPFPGFAREDPSHLLIVLLKEEVPQERMRAFGATVEAPEEVRPGRRCLYVTYPWGIARSKLTLPTIEAALRTRGTARNWNTVSKLSTLAGTP